MKILVVEDSKSKASEIAAVLSTAGIEDADILIVPDSQEAKGRLRSGGIALLILDLQIPKRFDLNPSESGGLELLRWMTRHSDSSAVKHIIALSAFELSGTLSDELARCGVPYVKYEASNDIWKHFTSAYVRRSLNGSTSAEMRPAAGAMDRRCNVVVLTTVEVELESACRVFNCEARPKVRGGESWYHGTVGDAKTPVIVGQAAQMGMPAAAVLAAKAFYTWSPQLLVMTGICAGIKGRVELGDLVVPDPAWDYGSGKMSAQGILHPDPRPISLGSRMRALVRSLQRSPELTRWHGDWVSSKPRTIPKLHLEPAASGAAVIQSEAVTKGITGQARKTVAIDMENFGLYFAASNLGATDLDFVSIKSVVDFADPDKNDNFQHFGADVSCRFASILIQAWIEERGSAGQG